MPRSQRSPLSQVPRGLQGSPAPPVSVGRMHRPVAEQTRSPEQSRPPGRPIASQHGWSMSPHANIGSVTRTHRVPSHASVGALHAEPPSQQGWPMSPQGVHRPVVASQTLPLRQVKPAQHMPPGPPHVRPSPGPPGPGPSMSSVSGSRQMPLAQTRPMQQSLAPEHEPPRGAQQPPSRHVSPVQQSAARAHRTEDPGPMQHTSPRPQRKPSSHVRPAQQAAPAGPQLALGRDGPASTSGGRFASTPGGTYTSARRAASRISPLPFAHPAAKKPATATEIIARRWNEHARIPRSAEPRTREARNTAFDMNRAYRFQPRPWTAGPSLRSRSCAAALDVGLSRRLSSRCGWRSTRRRPR